MLTQLVQYRRWQLAISLAGLLYCGFCWSPARADEETKITYDEHIKPIFREHCTACHQQSEKSSGLALDSYSDTLAGGSSGNVVASGNSGGSRLYALITHQQQPKMPPDEDPMAKEKLELIRIWIEQGMPENAGSKIKRASSAATAMLSTTTDGQPEGPPALPEKMLRQPIQETERSAAIAAMAASPWAPLIAVGGQDQVVLYHAETGELLGIVPFPEGEPQSLTFTRDGKQLLIGGGRHSHSGFAVLVDVITGQRIAKVGDELDIVLAADISPNKRHIAIGGPGRIVRVYDTLSGERVYELKKHTDWIYALRYSPDGVLLASGDRSNGLVLWEATTGNLYADLVGHKAAITGLDFRGDSNLLASSSHDETIKFWDMMESREVKSWAAHPGGANDVRFARDGRLVSAGKDAKVKLWNGNGELQKEYTGLTESALKASVTGDGAFVVGGDWTGKAQLWRSEAPEQTLLIAANPPSIEKRLAESAALLAALQQEFGTLSQATLLAMQQSTEANQQLESQQQAAKAMETQLAEMTQKEQTLKSSMAQADERMQKLQEEMVALQTQRQNIANDLAATSQTTKAMADQFKTAQEAVVVAQNRMQEMTKLAEAANQKQSEAQGRLSAAESMVSRAQADKNQLEQQAAELIAQAQQTTALAKQLAEQLSTAEQQEQSDKTVVEKMTVELTALKDQLSALQRRMDEIAGSHKQAADKLTQAQSSASELKAKAQTAEQTALEAQEKLKQFKLNYSDRSAAQTQ